MEWLPTPRRVRRIRIMRVALLGAMCVISGCGSNTCPADEGWGLVQLTSNPSPLTDAYVELSTGPLPTGDCTTTQDGSCAISVCEQPIGGVPVTPCMESTVFAGTVAVSGGPIAISIPRGIASREQDVTWSGGDALRVTATGDPD